MRSAQLTSTTASRCALASVQLLLVFFTIGAEAQPSASVNPLIKQDAAVKVAAHSYVILDDNVSFVPNVGIVVGDRATLVIDTGLGERNGRIVLGEARKLGDNREFYITATHYHPEHDLGATAFPENAKMIRWVVQQQEADDVGEATNRRFAGFSPVLAELLEGARFRDPDILFEDAITLDLGGVHVRIWGAGPNHTRGDTIFFVEEDRVLYTGDVVMPVFPAVNAEFGSLEKWIANLEEFEALEPVAVVPAHGRLGDASFIQRFNQYLTTVKTRVAELRSRGASLDDVLASLPSELEDDFADLRPAGGGPGPSGRIGGAIRAAYREAGT